MRLCLLPTCCLLVLLSVSVCLGQTQVIKLNNGYQLQGEVLKEGSDELYLDVGIDVLRIPLSGVESRSSLSEEGAPIRIEKKEIFQTARLPQRSVKKLAQEYGEGVVLVQTPSGLGSGFIVNENGYCVTNYHVIEREVRIAVTIFHHTESGEFTRRRIPDVKIVALNPFFDLALLRIPVQEDFKFQPVYLAEEGDQKEGDAVFAIGNPLGLERSVSQGIVSTRNRNFQGLVYIQTTTEINPGNSGGPLFNSRGEVIGVTNMKLLFSEGLGFAIPIDYVKHFLRNREAFAFDKNNPNSGYRYLEAPRRQMPDPTPGKEKEKSSQAK